MRVAYDRKRGTLITFLTLEMDPAEREEEYVE